MEQPQLKRISEFLFEIGTMRKLPRMHRQTLLTDDMSDNIATHSYRVSIIGWFLAKMERANADKVLLMCMLHDMREIRSGDHNWVHKKYVKVFENEIIKEQLGTLPFSDLQETVEEYDKRESKESVIAKDADLLDQILLLREYYWQGNKEAEIWLNGKPGKQNSTNNAQFSNLKTESAKKLGEEIMKEKPSDWWNNIWTYKNR